MADLAPTATAQQERSRGRRLLGLKAAALKLAENHLDERMFSAEGDDLIALVLAKAEIERVRHATTRKAVTH